MSKSVLVLCLVMVGCLDSIKAQESNSGTQAESSSQSKEVSASKMKQPLIVAHRGASKDAPENTIPAFRLAWQQNADAIEGDFHRTKDGVIVCIHDEETSKVGNVKKVVAESNWKDLKQLDVGTWFGKKYQGTSLPTLNDVFKTVPSGKQFYIEIKCGPEIVPQLIDEIEKSGLRHEQIVIISFKQEVIRAVEKQSGKYKTCWLTVLKEEKEVVRPEMEELIGTLKLLGCDGVSTHHENVTQERIKQVHNAGFEYHVWTVDDVELANQLISWGIDSVTTNVPGEMKKALGK